VINILIVGAGGFLGAAARYGVVVAVGKLVSQPAFPWGVLATNVAGSFIIGALAGIGDSRHIWSEQARLFLFLGLLGGFTTFSSISNDTLAMLRASNYVGAFGNVGLSLALGLAAVAVGYVAGKSGA
jgi:CrcB protein